MSNPELPSATIPSAEPDDSRTHTAEEQGIFNPYMAEAARSGVWPQHPESDETARPLRTSTPLYSHRGGRSFPGSPEGRLDTSTYEHRIPPTAEEIAEREAVLNGPGHRAAAVAAALAAHNAAARETKGDTIRQVALERSRGDKH